MRSIAKLGQANIYIHCRSGSGLAKLRQADVLYALKNWYRPGKTGTGQCLHALQKWVRPVEQKNCKALQNWDRLTFYVHCRSGTGLWNKNLKLGQAHN